MTTMSIRNGLAAASLTVCCATAMPAPAHADSPVGPLEETTFVAQRCGFPVLWDFWQRFHELDLPFGIIDTAPGWSITLTNLDTGKIWQPHGDGTLSTREQPDGSELVTADGLNFVSGTTALAGHFTSTVGPDGEQSEWQGQGQVIDICAMLS